MEKKEDKKMKQVTERFIEYAKIPTMSSETSESCPSTEKQWVLAKKIVSDLEALGLEVTLTDRSLFTLEMDSKTSVSPLETRRTSSKIKWR